MLNKGTTDTILKRLWYDAVLDWGLNLGPPALEASTRPLGYRGGGTFTYQHCIYYFRKKTLQAFAYLFLIDCFSQIKQNIPVQVLRVKKVFVTCNYQ